MKKIIYSIFFLTTAAIIGCSDDDESSIAGTAVEAAFINQEINLNQPESEISVVFSKATSSAGAVELNVVVTGVTYGIDFTTDPVMTGSTVTVPFSAGATKASFIFNKLTDAVEGEIKNVKFSIVSVSGVNAIMSNSTNFVALNFNEAPLSGSIITPNIGGNTFPNNVYVDLSSGATTVVPRTSWELGFYSGEEFRVALNPSVNKLAVKQLTTTNIDEVQVADESVTTGNYDPAGAAYIDNPYGNLDGTAIAEISADAALNKVYLVNLGQSVSDVPATDSNVALTGAERGWKKIRILREGNGYKLQYADLNATTHNEISIPKNPAYNFNLVSLMNGTVIDAQPLKEKWDINLGTFMNYTQYEGQNVSYYYSDFVSSNAIAGTRIYEVLTTDFSYSMFALANIDSAKLATPGAADRRAIGSNWRATFPSASIKTDRFYVVKDQAGNMYKLKFNAMVNGASQRGNITFEYAKL